MPQHYLTAHKPNLINFSYIIHQIFFPPFSSSSLSSFLPLLFHTPFYVYYYYLSLLLPTPAVFFITFLFFSSWSFPLPVIPTPLHFSTLVDICLRYSPFPHLFFHVTFFVARLVSLSLSLTVSPAHAINVSDCAILRHVKDMRRLSNRSIGSVWICGTPFHTPFLKHTHPETHTYKHNYIWKGIGLVTPKRTNGLNDKYANIM